MSSSLVAEILQETIIIGSLISMGMMLTLGRRTLLDHRYWVTAFVVAYTVTHGILLELVYSAPFVGTDWRTWAYAIAIAVEAVAVVGIIVDYRNGLRLGRLDRVIYSSETGAEVAEAGHVRETEQRLARRDLASAQEDIDGRTQSEAREDLEAEQENEQRS